VVYAGGDFTTAAGQPRNRLAAIDTATGSATSWDPGADAQVRALTIAANTLYAGGAFRVVGGRAVAGVAAFNLPTGVLSATQPAGSSTARPSRRSLAAAARCMSAGTSA